MSHEPQRMIRKSTLAEQGNDRDLQNTTPEERIAMMWPLAVSAWAMRGVDLRGSRLRRDIENVIRLDEK